MRILLTGSSGFIGTQLGPELVKRGHTLICPLRHARGRTLPYPAEIVEWSAIKELRGIEAVVHLAGENIAGKHWTETRKKELLASRAKTAQEIVELIPQIAAGGKLRAFVSASAVGIYGDRGDEKLTEDSAHQDGFVREICESWETEVGKASAHSERVCILRMGVVLGAGGGVLGTMLPVFKLGLGGKLGTGKQWFAWIHIRDAISLFVRAVESENMNGVYNGVAPGIVTNAEFTKALARVLRRPAFFCAPAFVLKLMLGEMSSLVLASQRVVGKHTEQSGFTFKYPEINGALGEIFG